MEPNAEALVKLWQNTRVPPPDKVASFKRGDRGPVLDYVGHADATDILLEHDPLWSWEPYPFGGGSPMVVNEKGQPVGLWIALTVHGHTRIGYGSVNAGKDDSVKELIGDAIRNASMRFGLAVTLWSKADRAEAESPGPRSAGKARGAAKAGKEESPAPPSPPAAAPALDQQRAELFSKVRSLSPAEIETLKAWLGEQKIGLDFSAHTAEEIDRIEAELVTNYREPF